jgi:hypothetical protein
VKALALQHQQARLSAVARLEGVRVHVNTTYLRHVRFDEAVTWDFAMALEAGEDSW